MEFDVVEGADSSLGDDAGPDGSSEAEMLFTVLRGMWTKLCLAELKETPNFLHLLDLHFHQLKNMNIKQNR